MDLRAVALVNAVGNLKRDVERINAAFGQDGAEEIGPLLTMIGAMETSVVALLNNGFPLADAALAARQKAEAQAAAAAILALPKENKTALQEIAAGRQP